PAGGSGPCGLHLTRYQSFVVERVEEVSHNVRTLRFAAVERTGREYPCGKHVSIAATIGEELVARPYTPITHPDDVDGFEVLFRVYHTGKLSPHLDQLRPGDRVQARGAFGRFKYIPGQHGCIGMVAAGTGITPCLQVIRYVLEGSWHRAQHPDDATRFVLFFQNRTLEDILLQQLLDDLRFRHPTRFVVCYFLTQPPTSQWASSSTIAAPTHLSTTNAQHHHLLLHSNAHPSPSEALFARDPSQDHNRIAGYITADHYRRHMPPSLCSLVTLCGPSGFIEVSTSLLNQVGYPSTQLFLW
ncbi:MAG: NADH-cytochrome b5 reductase, partial [archaeon]|nr:NADH-cytochrome b5 reductase [archaeon]